MSESNGNGVSKTAKKIVAKPFAKGFDPRRGHGLPGRSGRPPSEIREAMRAALAPRIKIAQQIADDPDASPSDRLRALDLLGKYGLGTTVTETDTEGRDVTIRVIREPRRLVVND